MRLCGGFCASFRVIPGRSAPSINAYPLLGVKAFMPPQGLLLIAAYLPRHWEVRFVDENVRPAKERDFRWADAVLVSGMHVQRRQINEINRRAHAAGKVTALGGPSVSSLPGALSGLRLPARWASWAMPPTR